MPYPNLALSLLLVQQRPHSGANVVERPLEPLSNYITYVGLSSTLVGISANDVSSTSAREDQCCKWTVYKQFFFPLETNFDGNFNKEISLHEKGSLL